ncbi:MAG: bifunctional metallophosphatase/5'-nucleotidase [Caldilineae bacterium]|nr:MAG: bifunctional metallophosphatase/5'-nucleotidase [Caldilineae bacterium]
MPHPPPPGVLRCLRGLPSPVSPHTDVYWLCGNAGAAPIHRIEFAPNVHLPPRQHFSAELPARLKILHFNDLHGHICRFSSHGETPIFARMVSRIRTLRREWTGRPRSALLVLSAGDDLVGSVFDELLGRDAESFQVHAGYRLYSAAGVQAAALGNHDFDMGPDVLAQAIRRDAQFPILSANLVGSRRLEGLVHPAALFVSGGIRIGVIGLSTPGEIGELWLQEFRLINPVQVVHNLLPALRPLCDVLIILSHLGYSLDSGTATVRYAGDVELARSLPRGSVQLIVGGHTHSILNEQGLSPQNVVNDIAIVQAGTLGEFLGEVDITLRGTPAVTHARLNRTALMPVDEAFEQEHVLPLKEMAAPLLAAPLGRTENLPDLGTDCVRNDLAAGESGMANFIADALVNRCRARGHPVDLAFVDATCIRTGIPIGGTVTFGQWFNVMPFADTIRLCWLTGRQLLALLQDNAHRIDRPGEPHIERGFLHFSSQIRYTIETGATRADARVRDVTFENEPLEHHLDRPLLAACTSFVRQPASAWEQLAVRTYHLQLFDLGKLSHLDTGLFLRRELVQYIRDCGGVTAACGARRDGRLVVRHDTHPPT